MDDDGLLRDVIWTHGVNGRPVDAYVRLYLNGQVEGTALFFFSADSAECIAQNSDGARMHQALKLTEPIDIFGAHPVSGDGMKTSLFDLAGPSKQTFSAVSSSDLPNGGSGPIMLQRRLTFELISEETLVTVPCGTFKCRHFRWHFEQFPPIEIWNTGIHHLPVRISWSLLDSRYDLVELNVFSPHSQSPLMDTHLPFQETS